MWSPFERRRRRVARCALYGSLLVVAAVTLLAYRWLARPLRAGLELTWREIDFASEPGVRLLQSYLRIDTTAANGDELAAALFLSTPLEAAGLDVTVERLGQRHANLWATLPGRDSRPLVLLSHLDVEPVDRRHAWLHPPFSGAIDGPFVYGRGAFDMKSYTVAQLWALLARATGPPPERAVRFVATTGEESGSELGLLWLLRQRPALLEDSWGVLTEGGMVEATDLHSVRFWALEVGQKRFVELVFCSGEQQLLEELRGEVRARGLPAVGQAVPTLVREVWGTYAATRGREELRELLAEPDRFLRDPVALRRLPPYLRSMLRNEAIASRVQPSPGGGWQLRVLLHLLPGAAVEEAWGELLPPWAASAVAHTIHEPPPAPPSPMDHALPALVTAAIRARHPGVTLGPYFLPWTGTDSRFLRARGIASYGFSPFLILTTDNLATGRPNERLSLPGFLSGLELYAAVVEAAARTRE